MSTDQQPSDAELISAVRGGDSDAYGELFERHVEAARRLARQLTSAADVEDLVAEAFAKVLTIVRRGGGPDLAFRAYLLTAVRSLHIDSVRGATRLRPVDDFAPFDDGVPFRDTAVEGFESKAAARAFASLPERWQLVLWHTEVEGQKPAEVAKLLGMSANSVSALAYRAREGLRQAFLTMHAQDAEDDACAWTQDNLGAYIRNASSRRDSAKVRAHVDECRRCMGIYLELSEVNTNLSGILGPLVLGSAASGYIAAAMSSEPGRLLGFVSGHASGFAVAGVAAVLALLAGVVFALRGPAPDAAQVADPPFQGTSSAQLAGPGFEGTIGQAEAADRPSQRPERAPGEIDTSQPPLPPSSTAATTTAPSTPHTEDRFSPKPPKGSFDPPDAPPADPQPTPPVLVDTKVSAQVNGIDPEVINVTLTVQDLPAAGGILDITTSKTAEVRLNGFCAGDSPARSCSVPANPAPLNFQIVSSDVKGEAYVWFTVRPAEGDDPDLRNNVAQVELQPTS